MAKKGDAQAIGREWNCNICKAKVPKGVSPKIHKRAHAKCDTCLEIFGSHAALIAHQHTVNHCYCRGCDLYFKTRDKHIMHLRQPPKSYQEFRATQAEAKGSDLGSKPAAWRGHGDHECGKCHRDYPDANMLRYHCCSCDRVYRAEVGLNNHLAADPKHAADMSATEKATLMCRHLCPICLEAFQKLRKLRNHIRKNHATVCCPLGCGEVFSTPQDLVNHWRHGRCIEVMSSLAATQEAGRGRRSADHSAQMEGVDKVDDGAQQWIIGLFEEAIRKERAVNEIADIMERLQLLPTEEPGDVEGHDVAPDDNSDSSPRAIVDLSQYHGLISQAKALSVGS
ncbi:hypothetical protein RB595_008394 [Gaeumannomyces hyphopodioides]